MIWNHYILLPEVRVNLAVDEIPAAITIASHTPYPESMGDILSISRTMFLEVRHPTTHDTYVAQSMISTHLHFVIHV